jgi:hypothetical protein
MRYHFDLYDGQGVFRDAEGLELSSMQAAQEEAARTLAELARDRMRRAEKHAFPHQMVIEVRNQSGPVLRAT